MMRNYRKALAAISSAVLLALAPQAQAQSNAATAGENWPFPANMAPNFEPRFVDVSIIDVYPQDFSLRGFAKPIYGVLGLHMVCETATEARRLIPFGGAQNRIFDLSRDRATREFYKVFSGNRGTRRFLYDRECLKKGRLAIQVQTNLKQRESIKARDVNYGFVNTVFYFDQLPGLSESKHNARGTRKGVWSMFSYTNGGARRSLRPVSKYYNMIGEIRLVP